MGRLDAGGGWVTALLGAFALIPRLWAVLRFSREPVWDGHYYHFGAQRIAEGLGYSEDALVGGVLRWRPWCHYPVGYSGLLGGLYRVLGDGLLVAPLFNVLVGVATVVCVHRLALHYLPGWRAVLAALLVALHPGLILYSALVMTEPLAAFIAVLWLYVLSLAHRSATQRGRTGRRELWGWWALAGVVLGLGALVRPAYLIAAPLVLLFVGRSWRPALMRTAVVALCTVLPILPWTLRNCARMDGCALISTNGGWNLAIGAITQSGRFETLHASDGCRVVTGQVQQDRCWSEVGMRRIVTAPRAWLAKAPHKLEQLWNHESFPVEYLREADPVSWPEARRVAARELLTDCHRFLVVVAGLGALSVPWSKRRRWWATSSQALLLLLWAVLSYRALQLDEHPVWLVAFVFPLLALLPLPGRPRWGVTASGVAALITTVSLTHILFFGEDRYHMVVSPLLALMAAAALRWPALSSNASGSARALRAR